MTKHERVELGSCVEYTDAFLLVKRNVNSKVSISICDGLLRWGMYENMISAIRKMVERWEC